MDGRKDIRRRISVVQKNLLVLFFLVAKRLKTKKDNPFLGPFMRQLQWDLMAGVSPGSCFCEGKKSSLS